MRVGRNPLFRKVIVPWYDSETACYSGIVLMAAVLLFCILGVAAAREIPGYRGYTWVPVLLILMSIGVLISITIRLIKRSIHPYSG